MTSSSSKPRFVRWSILGALVLLSILSRSAAADQQLNSIALLDCESVVHQLSEFDRDYLVIVYLGLECPLCKLYSKRLNELAAEYANRVDFVGIVPNHSDELAEMAEFSRKYNYQFPIYKDELVKLGDAIGANINPEVFVLDRARNVCYRGRIDDQYVPGLSRQAPDQEELRSALEQLVAGGQVSPTRTKPIGCLIQRPVVASQAGELTYYKDIQPIIHQRCNGCHNPRGKAPFELTNYDIVATWADTIQLVLDERRMPPWFVDPAHGEFANQAAITESERARLLRWLDDGVPMGDEKDAQDLPELASAWSIPQPNLIVSMQEPFTVPATGVVDYQYVLIDLSFEKDLWVQAAEIKPGNPQVVHHCVVLLVPPGKTAPGAAGDLGSMCFVVDSIPQLNLAPGLAKRIPAGWRLMFVMHYTPVGSEQTDQTQLGLHLVDATEVQKEVATHVLYATEMAIPPQAANYSIEMSHTFKQDVDLLSLFPHMHYRGKSFYYEAIYPDGHTETLLNLKKWDFNWQHNYQLRQPKRLPAGTMLRTVGYYDNTSANPANPDPDVWVYQGDQTTDEMFNAYFDFVLADDDLQSPVGPVRRLTEYWTSNHRISRWFGVLASFGLALMYGKRFLPEPPTDE
jgi:thiol-disulfide isomerase/thioredoxin